jgi:hypothetical protein
MAITTGLRQAFERSLGFPLSSVSERIASGVLAETVSRGYSLELPGRKAPKLPLSKEDMESLDRENLRLLKRLVSLGQ